ncbi:hypothetical protein SOVF_034060 [Spinacia oleracea]|nr:hypothetical protein SOVF_034060 [Spinacia oleracea]
MAAALLLLQLHACNARHTFDLVSYTKDSDADKTKIVDDEMNIKGLHVLEDTKFKSSDDVTVATLENNTRPAREVQGFGEKTRSMIESKSHDETKEATNEDEGEPVEDAVVMDYVLPHRKSPIHNHH